MSQFTRRTFLSTSATLGAGAIALPHFARAQAANDTISVGVIGCGGRGNELIKQILDVKKKNGGVDIVGLCDADSARTASTATTHELSGAKHYTDLRKLLEDKAIDAVAIATCNHWHCLAAVWACQAGKDVYCEKPLSHSLWEGRALIKAAKDNDRIVQVGTQQRSDPLQAEVKDFLHDQRALGKIKSVVIARFGVRASIGKTAAPINPPETVDYNLWLGPAQDEPIFRNAFHYDWHWSWNTGDGECGNWGVHLLDDVVNVVFRDKAKLPSCVASGGGRVVWNDAGQSPNFHVAYMEAENTPVLFALSNLPSTPGSTSALKFDNVECGYVVLCEGGVYRGVRGSGVAVDPSGKVIKKFPGDSGAGHMKNFVDAVRAHDRSKMNAPVEVGHSSAGWAHVINAAYRAAKHPDLAPHGYDITQVEGYERLQPLIAEHMKTYDLSDDAGLRSSGLFQIDVDAEEFSGAGAEVGNAHLGKPNYRGEFAIKA
jgi:predicted dehydrogenase